MFVADWMRVSGQGGVFSPLLSCLLFVPSMSVCSFVSVCLCGCVFFVRLFMFLSVCLSVVLSFLSVSFCVCHSICLSLVICVCMYDFVLCPSLLICLSATLLFYFLPVTCLRPFLKPRFPQFFGILARCRAAVTSREDTTGAAVCRGKCKIGSDFYLLSVLCLVW